jgi:hypothetical protein
MYGCTHTCCWARGILTHHPYFILACSHWFSSICTQVYTKNGPAFHRTNMVAYVWLIARTICNSAGQFQMQKWLERGLSSSRIPKQHIKHKLVWTVVAYWKPCHCFNVTHNVIYMSSLLFEVQSMPSRHLLSIYKAWGCKHVWKYRRSWIETVHLSTHIHLCLLCLHRLGCLGGRSCCFHRLLCHAFEYWGLEKDSGMQLSLKTSFLEPDQTTSRASTRAILGTWEHGPQLHHNCNPLPKHD